MSNMCLRLTLSRVMERVRKASVSEAHFWAGENGDGKWEINKSVCQNWILIHVNFTKE